MSHRDANDPILGELLAARDETAHEKALEALVTRAQLVARRAVDGVRRSTLRAEDAADVVGNVLLRLVRELRERPAAITAFDGFVARMTYNSLNDFFRTRFPERTRLKNRIRYLLTHDGRLTTWRIDRGMAAGLAKWRKSETLLRSVDLPRHRITPTMLDRDAPADALVDVLHAFGAPLLVDDLVTMVGELWGVADHDDVELTDPIDEGSSVADDLERRQSLDHLWREIRELRAPQRAALLLNFRDGDGRNALALFLLLGTATFDQISQALEMTPAQLAAIWNELPMDDLRIAARLGVQRQQVINLRKAARDRLARRTNQ